jgi:hypothetical protein
MLFMGSERYPDENDYDAFLTAHGGASNACTEEVRWRRTTARRACSSRAVTAQQLPSLILPSIPLCLQENTTFHFVSSSSGGSFRGKRPPYRCLPFPACLPADHSQPLASSPLPLCRPQDVKPDALRPALDRFAQFFISPLVKADALEREVQAVDNEFAGVLQVGAGGRGGVCVSMCM